MDQSTCLSSHRSDSHPEVYRVTLNKAAKVQQWLFFGVRDRLPVIISTQPPIDCRHLQPVCLSPCWIWTVGRNRRSPVAYKLMTVNFAARPHLILFPLFVNVHNIKMVIKITHLRSVPVVLRTQSGRWDGFRSFFLRRAGNPNAAASVTLMITVNT